MNNVVNNLDVLTYKGYTPLF